MTLTIPTEGLVEIRRVWAGRGGLWNGIAAVESDRGDTWTPELARRRATRVVVELLRPQLLTWPESHRMWLDALPAQTLRRRVVSDVPGAGVDWPLSRMGGWPPREFHHRRRTRVADTVLVTVTRWTIEKLVEGVVAVDALDPSHLGAAARSRVMVAQSMLNREPLASAHLAMPTRQDLAALRSSGRPWASVAAVAGWLRVLDHDATRLADMPINPDPVLADRLFHVAVLGSLLRGLRATGWNISVVGLPGSPNGSPPFVATDPVGDTWDLWFEMSGAWAHYGVPAPYSPAVAGIVGTGGPLGADIALLRHGDRAVLIECKYSENPTYVGRNGYEQVLAYMTEALTGLASTAAGVVVGPDEIVTATGATSTSAGPVIVTNPGLLMSAVAKGLHDVTGSVLH